MMCARPGSTPARAPRPSTSRLAAGMAGLAMLAIAGCAPPPTATGPGPERSAGETSTTGSLDAALAARAARAEDEDTRTASTRDLIVSEEDWTYAGRTGRIITTPHFRIHTTLTRSLLLDRAPNFTELALASYRTALGDLPEPGARLDTFILNDRSQWESMTRTIAGGQAETYLRIPRGGFALGGKGVYYDIGPRDTLSIAAHEGWHQYTQATFQHNLPLWLEEGIAAYFEGFRWDSADRTLPVFLPWSNPQRFDTLRKAEAEDRLMPLATILVSRPQDLIEHTDGRALTYYAQVWALAHFLREGAGAKYRDSLERLLLDAAEGRMFSTIVEKVGVRDARRSLGRRTGDAVFRAYFNADIEEAQAEYTRFIEAATLPGTRNDMTAGRSPFSTVE